MDIDQLNNTLSSQLLYSREFVSEFTDRIIGEDIDLSSPIELIQNLIDLNIKLEAEFEWSNDIRVKEAKTVLTETFEHYYTALRILKKHNKRNNIPTSQMAIDSCRYSLNTLQRIIR